MGKSMSADRFAVVNNEKPLSTVWRAWLEKRDLYIAARNLGGLFKTSLHHPDIFRHAFTKEAAVHVQPAMPDRAVKKWSRPKAQQPEGTLLFQVLIPASELGAPLNEYPLPEKLIRLPSPEVHTLTAISFFELELTAPQPRFGRVR